MSNFCNKLRTVRLLHPKICLRNLPKSSKYAYSTTSNRTNYLFNQNLYFGVNTKFKSKLEVNRNMSTILYKIDPSPPSRAALMIVDILGLNFEMRDLNPVIREQDEPEYVKINPMRTIPILDEGDYSLADSHAIILYLLDKYGKPEHSHLYPSDKRKRATINHRLFFDCGILFPRLRAIMAPTYSGKLTELTKYMKINMEDAYKILEAYLSETLYLADDVVTVADISAITTVGALDGLHPADEKRFPKLKQWLKNMSEQDVCKRINEPGAEIFLRTLRAFMENNKENQKSKL